MKVNLYDRYTSTCMLAGEDVEALLAWGQRYFQYTIRPHLPPDRDARILECGSGYGRHLKALREGGYRRVTGVDISQEQVRYAREKLGLDGIHCADAGTFRSSPPSDVVLLLDVLE